VPSFASRPETSLRLFSPIRSLARLNTFSTFNAPILPFSIFSSPEPRALRRASSRVDPEDVTENRPDRAPVSIPFICMLAVSIASVSMASALASTL
jgi:hypothetical protein